MAAQSFVQHADDFHRGIDGLLDLIDGCPEMLAEGLAERDGFSDVSMAEWERRFENSFRWLEALFLRLWLAHYDLSEDEIKEIAEEHEDEKDSSEEPDEEWPSPANQTCACGAALPGDAPTIITRWKEATEATAVCFQCFGQVSTRIAVSG